MKSGFSDLLTQMLCTSRLQRKKLLQEIAIITCAIQHTLVAYLFYT